MQITPPLTIIINPHCEYIERNLLLFYIANDSAWRGLHFDLLETTEATPGTAASERAFDVDDLPLGVVKNSHVKRTRWSTVLPQTTVGIYSDTETLGD